MFRRRQNWASAILVISRFHVSSEWTSGITNNLFGDSFLKWNLSEDIDCNFCKIWLQMLWPWKCNWKCGQCNLERKWKERREEKANWKMHKLYNAVLNAIAQLLYVQSAHNANATKRFENVPRGIIALRRDKKKFIWKVIFFEFRFAFNQLGNFGESEPKEKIPAACGGDKIRCWHLFLAHCSHRSILRKRSNWFYLVISLNQTALKNEFQWRPNVSDSQHTFSTARYITNLFFFSFLVGFCMIKMFTVNAIGLIDFLLAQN